MKYFKLLILVIPAFIILFVSFKSVCAGNRQCTPEPSSVPEESIVPSVSSLPTPSEESSPIATVSATPTSVSEVTPAPKGPPEWENPCFYLKDHEECKEKDKVFPGEGKVFGPVK